LRLRTVGEDSTKDWVLEDLPILARDDRDGLHHSAKHQPYHHEHHPHPKAEIRAHEANVDQVQWAKNQRY